MRQDGRFSFFETGLEYTVVPLKSGSALMTVCVEHIKGETPPDMYRRLYRIIKKYKATPLMQWIFGGIHPVTRKTDVVTQRFVRDAEWPVIWLNGDGNPKPGVTSTQLIAIINPEKAVKAVRLGKGTPMVTYNDAHAQFGYIGGSLNLNAENDESVSAQADAAFEAMRTMCHFCHDAKFTDIARTWLYLDKLLVWYDDFNVVRTDFFNKMRIFTEGIVPSSTGIGAINQDGSSTSLSAFVVKPLSDKVKVEAVPSPLQCPALNYKSSFSRAHLITHPDYKQLLISGTASILPDGESEFIDEPYEQIKLTMQVVDKILEAQKFEWSEVTRAICYFKDYKDVAYYHEFLEKHHLPDFPTICVQADVCRDELLFEIELDAVKIR